MPTPLKACQGGNMLPCCNHNVTVISTEIIANQIWIKWGAVDL